MPEDPKVAAGMLTLTEESVSVYMFYMTIGITITLQWHDRTSTVSHYLHAHFSTVYSVFLDTMLYLQVAAPPSLNVPVGFVSLLPHDAMESGGALMEVMRESAVSFSQ